MYQNHIISGALQASERGNIWWQNCCHLLN